MWRTTKSLSLGLASWTVLIGHVVIIRNSRWFSMTFRVKNLHVRRTRWMARTWELISTLFVLCSKLSSLVGVKELFICVCVCIYIHIYLYICIICVCLSVKEQYCTENKLLCSCLCVYNYIYVCASASVKKQ